MIYTLTLNPSLDRVLEVEELVPDDANRVQAESRWAGGKGIDASRVFREMGVEAVALGLVGGFDGLEFEGLLINEGVLTRFVRISGETRINVFVENRKTGTQTGLNSPGPEVKPSEVAELFQQIRGLKDATHVLLCGSVPRGLSRGVYAQLILELREKGVFIALDTDGEALARGVKAGPDVIKPNVHELSRLVGRKLSSEADIVEAAREAIGMGVGSVLATLGGEGMIFVAPEGKPLHAKAPDVEVKSAIGAGDSALAGYVLALFRGDDPADRLRLAAASGAATAMTPGVALCKKEDVERLAPLVEVRAL